MQLKHHGRTARHPLWDKEQVLKDFAKYGTQAAVCRLYCGDPKNWYGYYADIWRWRKSDPDFNNRMVALGASELNEGSPGRPPLDGGDHSWHEKFCTELYKCNGNKEKASKVTPYSFRQIIEKLDNKSTSFDKEFKEKVQAVYLKMAAEYEEMFLSLRDQSNYATFDAAKIAQTKGWVAIKGLEKLDSERWGRKAELAVSGKVDIHHRLDDMTSRPDMIKKLWEDRKRFLETRKTQLAIESGEYVEAEVIEDTRDGEQS